MFYRYDRKEIDFKIKNIYSIYWKNCGASVESQPNARGGVLPCNLCGTITTSLTTPGQYRGFARWDSRTCASNHARHVN